MALMVFPGMALAIEGELQSDDYSNEGSHPRAVNTVHIDGQNGSDSNAGEDASTAVQTIAKAAELAGEGGTIVVDGNVVIDEKTDLSNLVIERGDNMKGTLLSVQNEVSLTNVTIDGKTFLMRIILYRRREKMGISSSTTAAGSSTIRRRL